MILTLVLNGCKIPVLGSFSMKQSLHWLFKEAIFFFFLMLCGSQITRHDIQGSTIHVYEF